MSSQITGTRVHPEATGGDETLVAADDDRVLPPCEDGLDEAPLAEAAGQRLELVLADSPGVRRVGTELVDRDLLDAQVRWRDHSSHAEFAYRTGCWPRLSMRTVSW